MDARFFGQLERDVPFCLCDAEDREMRVGQRVAPLT